MPKRNKPLKSSSYPPSLCAGVSTSGAPPRPLAATFHSLPLLSLSYYFTISILLLYNLYPFSILSLSFNFLRLPPFIFAPFVAFCSFSIPVSKVAPVSRASARDFCRPSHRAFPRPPRCLAFPSAPLQPAFLVAPSSYPSSCAGVSTPSAPSPLISKAAPVSRASARDKDTNHRLSAQKQRKTPFIQKKARKHLAVSRKVRTFALAFKNRALGHEVLSENPKLF